MISEPFEQEPQDLDQTPPGAVEEVEIVDALPAVVNEVRVLESPRPSSGAAVAQAAAAVGGFVAGAATAAVVGRHLGRRLGRPRPAVGVPRAGAATAGREVFDIVSSRTYLVHVHVLGRRVD